MSGGQEQVLDVLIWESSTRLKIWTQVRRELRHTHVLGAEEIRGAP